MKELLKNKTVVGIILAVFVVGIVIAAICLNQNNNGAEDSGSKGENLVIPDGESFDYQETETIKIGDYKKVEVLVEPDEEDIDLELSAALDDKFEVIEENKTIKKGDYAYVDYTASIEGIELEDLQGEDVLLIVGKHKYLEAFEDALVGREVGQTYSVPLSFSKDYPDAALAGREVTFKVNIKAKFDDAYADKISKGKCKDVASYRKNIEKRLRKENMENLSELAWDALMEQSHVNQYPKQLVEEEVENLNMQYADFAEITGVSYEELMESLMMDEDSVKDTAKDVVRDRMVAKTMAKWENFKLDDETCRKYLIKLMEFEEDDDETLEHLYDDYKLDYGSRPNDDILVAMAKDFVSEHAVIK